MRAPIFNTLKFSKKLGTEYKAEVVAEALNDALQESLYTKDEINKMFHQVIINTNDNLIKSFKEISESSSKKFEALQSRIDQESKSIKRTLLGLAFSLAGLIITLHNLHTF